MHTEPFGSKDSRCAGLDFCWDPSAEAPFRRDRCESFPAWWEDHQVVRLAWQHLISHSGYRWKLLFWEFIHIIDRIETLHATRESRLLERPLLISWFDVTNVLLMPLAFLHSWVKTFCLIIICVPCFFRPYKRVGWVQCKQGAKSPLTHFQNTYSSFTNFDPTLRTITASNKSMSSYNSENTSSCFRQKTVGIQDIQEVRQYNTNMRHDRLGGGIKGKWIWG